MGYTLSQLRHFSEAAIEMKQSELLTMALNVRSAFHADKKQFEAHIRSLTSE